MSLDDFAQALKMQKLKLLLKSALEKDTYFYPTEFNILRILYFNLNLM